MNSTTVVDGNRRESSGRFGGGKFLGFREEFFFLFDKCLNVSLEGKPD